MWSHGTEESRWPRRTGATSLSRVPAAVCRQTRAACLSGAVLATEGRLLAATGVSQSRAN